MKLNNAVISHRAKQLHSFQFHSTKLNEFSKNFNAQLSRSSNTKTEGALQPEGKARSSVLIIRNKKKFTIKLYGVLFKRIHTQSSEYTDQGTNCSSQHKCFNCNCIFMQSKRIQSQSIAFRTQIFSESPKILSLCTAKTIWCLLVEL